MSILIKKKLSKVIQGCRIKQIRNCTIAYDEDNQEVGCCALGAVISDFNTNKQAKHSMEHYYDFGGDAYRIQMQLVRWNDNEGLSFRQIAKKLEGMGL